MNMKLMAVLWWPFGVRIKTRKDGKLHVNVGPFFGALFPHALDVVVARSLMQHSHGRARRISNREYLIWSVYE